MFSKILSHFSENKLTKQQKHATAVLSIGTFLEYFDLYLYLHMITFMDKIFFPPTCKGSWFLSNLALCSNFIFRPIGALLLGWLGDNIGRKSTIFISTTVTSICCLVTAYLPTYDEIGVKAAYILTICRLMQGMISSGEVLGARIYLIETTKNTINQCALSGTLDCLTAVGRFSSVAVASIVINVGGESWRKVFLAGAIVALVGAYARSSLKETPEFADAKRRLKQSISELEGNVRESHPLFKIKSNKKDIFYLFILKCGEALALFFGYTYCAKYLIKLGVSSEQGLNYSTYASIYESIAAFTLLFLVLKFDPLKIIKFRISISALLLLITPILFKISNSITIIFIAQVAILVFKVSDYPASPVIYKRFPILQRFTSILMISAISRAITWPLCTYGISFATDNLGVGHYGLYIIFLPLSILSIMAIRHFIKVSNINEAENIDTIKNKTLQNAY